MMSSSGYSGKTNKNASAGQNSNETAGNNGRKNSMLSCSLARLEREMMLPEQSVCPLAKTESHSDRSKLQKCWLTTSKAYGSRFGRTLSEPAGRPNNRGSSTFGSKQQPMRNHSHLT